MYRALLRSPSDRAFDGFADPQGQTVEPNELNQAIAELEWPRRLGRMRNK
jgi:hypothetical protein